MAQRLEAALRRPPRTDDARPAQGTPQAAPQAAPKAAPEPEPAEETDEYTPAPAATFAPPAARAAAEAARPARGDAKPARIDAKPAMQKSLYDSLEQEMASLLGRPNTKP
jgi:flagellar protein FliO/FliZ